MAKIVQVLTRPSEEYDLPTAEAQVRDLDAIVEKLNTTFQQELKELQRRIDKGDFDGRDPDDAPGGAASNQDARRGGQYG